MLVIMDGILLKLLQRRGPEISVLFEPALFQRDGGKLSVQSMKRSFGMQRDEN
jgi:hypothetical protein